jgi:hypothetical protein
MSDTVIGRLAKDDHPNGQRIVGGETFTRKWGVYTVTSGNAALINADAALETMPSGTVFSVPSGTYTATSGMLGSLFAGFTNKLTDAQTIVDRVEDLFTPAE